MLVSDGKAEVTFDGSLGPQKTLTGPDYDIKAEDGTIINQSNLFHSFGKFIIDTNESATFSGPDAIGNIIGRVTGGTQSWIDGLIRSTIPDANLFLLNPSGMLFGPNASLDVQGSFHVSTADFLRLGENGIFYADPAQDSILTVDPPSSFGFLGDNPAGIYVQESFLRVPEGKTLSLVGGDIVIVGDDESVFASADLYAPSGRINIVSVASAGEVITSAADEVPNMEVGSFEQLGNIALSQGTLLDASGDSGGTVVIKGGRLMADGSYIVSNTLGNLNGAAVAIDIDLKGDFTAYGSLLQAATVGQGASGDVRIVSDSLEIQDSSIEAFSYYGPGDGGDIEIATKNLAAELYSTIKAYSYGSPGDSGNIAITSDNLAVDYYSSVYSMAYSSGEGGNIDVDTGSLNLQKGGQIFVKAYGSGDSGDLSIVAETIKLSSTDNFSRPASLGATTASGSSAHGGNLRLTTGSLEVRDGAQIDITVFGAGDAGNLDLNADTVLISGINGYNAPAAIFARARGSTGGNAGQVHITSGSVEVLDGGTISTSSYGYGTGGELIVDAEHVRLSGTNNPQFATGFFARGYYGDGGDIRINTDSLEVTDGAAISCSSKRSGAGGAIDVTANRVLLSGTNQLGSRAGILSQSESIGAAGDIQIAAQELEVKNGAIVSVGALGTGASGDLQINAGSVLISGRQLDKSAMLTAGTKTEAQGGNIGITTNSLEVINGGNITVSTSSSGNAGLIDIAAKSVLVSGVDSDNAARIMSQTNLGSTGNAGDIQIVSDTIEVSDGADISVSTYGTGDGGSIKINAEEVAIDGGNNPEYGVGLYSDTRIGGKAGDVFLSASNLEVINGGQISSGTLGIGDGGSIHIDAERISLSGTSSDQIATGLFARTQGSGQGGSIFVSTDNLQVADGAAIDSSAFGSGDGGQIDLRAASLVIGGINSGEFRAGILATTNGTLDGSGDAGTVSLHVENIELKDRGLITTQTLGAGDGGEIELEATKLKLASGAEISSSSYGTGQAGGVTVFATESVSISGMGHEKSSGFFSTASDAGNAGSLTVISPSLVVADGGEINTSSSGPGAGGDIQLQGDKLTLSTGSLVSASSTGLGDGGTISISTTDNFYCDNSSVSTAAEQAKGGDIAITSREMLLDNGTLVSAESSGEGNAGDISLGATESFLMRNSSVTTEAQQAQGGTIDISGRNMQLLNNALVSAKSYGAGNAGNISMTAQETFHSDSSSVRTSAEQAKGGDITISSLNMQLLNNSLVSAESSGEGNAGDIYLGAADSFLMRNSAVTTEAKQADGGNIKVDTGYMVHLVDSEITASVGGGPATVGGNISIDPEYVVLNNSRIIANAFEGRGGNIDIISDVFLADPNSIVDASSALGIDGRVDIRAPITSVSGTIAPLPKDFRSVIALLREPCMARIQKGKYSSFVVGGRDALPLEPDGVLPSPLPLQ